MIRVGLIGFGYWGPNVAKNIDKIHTAQFTVVVDKIQQNTEKARKLFPNIFIHTDIDMALGLADAFIIATPIETHFSIAKKLLENNKHVLIQKPMAHSKETCAELNRISIERNLQLMVAHTFLFSAAIQRMKQDISANEYGDLNYISSCRVNLGLFQRHHNVIWDLAPHDFSIIKYLYPEKPKYISAIGKSHTPSKLIDCANITIGYDNDFIATININWLSAIKVRNLSVSGTQKMAIYDDCAIEKLKIYDSGVEYNEDIFSYRKGDIFTPKLEEKESIYVECLDFINSILNNKNSISDGLFGQEIVELIEATNKSIDLIGAPVYI